MGSTTKFILLQASIVFNNQISIFDDKYEDTKEGRNAVFRDAIRRFAERKMIKINPRTSEYILLFRNMVTEDILYAQLAKKMEMRAYPLKGNDIQFQNIDSYPPLDVFINLKTQQFAVEQNSSILSVSAIETHIKNLINSLVKGYSIFVNSIQDKKEFWSVVTQEDDVQEISFDLIVPNLFEATEAAKELVDDSKKNLNADSVELSFKNKKGKLRLDASSIQSFVSYSSMTGSWRAKIRRKGEKRYKVFKSSDFSLKKDVDDAIIDAVRSMNSDYQIEMDVLDNLIIKLYELFNYEE